jgi:uncharacterized protein (TIGR02265 family)
MPADRTDLAARLAAATRHDTAKGFLLNAAFEVARREVDDATAEQCDGSGAGKRADATAYPVKDLLEVVWAAADRLERPMGGVAPALEAMGRQAAQAWLGSLRGRGALLLARDPRAVLGLLPAGYAAGVSYGERYLAWPAEGACRLELDHDFLPLAWHRGFAAAFLAAAAKDGARKGGGAAAGAAAVEGQVPGFMRAVLDVRWA